ncbi:MAG: Flp pilus assembly complex ATPase component TadA [Acidobacteria bacterium]|nr:Flp pilus assembly complex ATPase component TadA [Acidobacteriota bacterium]
MKLTYTPKDDLTRAVGKHYSTSQEAAAKGAEAAKAISSEALRRQIREIDDGGDMADIFDLILEGAMNSNASDIHLEPAKDFLSIRYEIDGKPHAQPNQQKHIAVRLASYIKSQAKLQPTDLQDQNGMFSKTIQGETRDIRVAVLPCQWGESITLRLASEKIMDLSRIGFSPLNEQLWRSQLSQPNGLILSVGPMGSGKTAMSMASLGEHMKTGRKIVTIENPVETRVPAGVTQVSINPGRNMTWGSVSGTVLRSAAKTIFFGEINHEDVAQAAVNMAMTGHIVISTLHTNTAPGAILRLRELGLRPSVLADTMRAVCAQRLPRTLCPHCKVAGPPPEAMIRDFQLDPSDLSDTEWFNSRPGGCRECYGIGYKGRSPIHELLIFDDELRELVIEDVPNSVLTRTAREHGMHTLKEDGVLMAKSGATSLEEIRQHIIL